MTENIKFQTETSKILQIVVNSLYSEKEIFLRELISNASDALDKLRYAAITHPGLASKNGEPKIIIKIEPKNNLLVIKDNGIGMNKEDLINNLGTIAKSGSFDFVKNLTGDAKKDIELIGQFGVGFYSAFMVAKKVEVLTKKAAEDKAWRWESDGFESFSITEAANANFGTEIKITLKDEDKEFLEPIRIRQIVKQYSDHISYPIKLLNDGVEETLNSSSALWTRNKAEITQKEYKEFYQYLSHNFDEPWDTLHFKAEGSIEYTALLFIPSARPFNMFTPNQKKGLKLYVSKVFISDEIEDILPNYLRFVRGIVDSPDLQLNVSREMLQNSSVINKMKKGMVRRILDELKKKSENKEDYHKFIEAFGTVLKEGIYEDFEKAPEIAGLCRFNSVLLEEKNSLDDYIVKMKPEQKAIYYLTGDNLVCLKNNPQIEAFVSANIDVLLLDEPVDEFWCQNLTKYKDIPLKSILNAEEDLENLIINKKNKSKIKKEDVNALILKLKDVYKAQVKDVIVSYKLVKSPVCITSENSGISINFEKIMSHYQNAQAYKAQRILLINPYHEIIIKMAQKLKENKLDDDFYNAAELLMLQAKIIANESLDDLSKAMESINKIIEKVL